MKKLSGTSGERERCSITRNAAMSTAEPIEPPIVWADAQPTLVDCVSPKTKSMRLAVTVTAPAASKWRARPSARLSRT